MENTLTANNVGFEVGNVDATVFFNNSHDVDITIDTDDVDGFENAVINALPGNCDGIWPDESENPDGYDGAYGVVTDSGLSVHGRYSVERR